jgi:hypothetical protein
MLAAAARVPDATLLAALAVAVERRDSKAAAAKAVERFTKPLNWSYSWLKAGGIYIETNLGSCGTSRCWLC